MFPLQEENSNSKDAAKGVVSSRTWKNSINGFDNGRKNIPLFSVASDDGGILEGVSSLHSWIKKNTVIPPTEKMKKLRSLYDDVNIVFHSTLFQRK